MAKLQATTQPAEVDATPIETTNGVAPEAGDTKKLSPKNKKSLGIPEDHVISWVPMDAPKDYNELLRAVATVRGVSIVNFLRDELKATLGSKHEALIEEAKAYVPNVPSTKSKAKSLDSMSDEEVEAAVSKAEAAVKAAEAKARQMLAAAAARRAATAQG